jgi:hypothetical protein
LDSCDTSPNLNLLCASGTHIRNCWFTFFKTTNDGVMTAFYRVKGTDVQVMSVKQIMSDRLDLATSNHPSIDEVTFKFNRVEFEVLTETQQNTTSSTGQTGTTGTTTGAVGATATQAQDGAVVAYKNWFYTGDNQIALNVQGIQQAKIWFGGGGVDAHNNLMEAQISFRNDGNENWGPVTDGSIQLVLLDADGQTISNEVRMFYTATEETGGAYQILKKQSLNFTYNISYNAKTKPSELRIQGFGSSLRYKIATQ